MRTEDKAHIKNDECEHNTTAGMDYFLEPDEPPPRQGGWGRCEAESALAPFEPGEPGAPGGPGEPEPPGACTLRVRVSVTSTSSLLT